MRVLIIEDDKIKIEKLSDFFSNSSFSIRDSYHSGLKELMDSSIDYDVLILDMTIPLWDKNHSDLGGNFEQFGGERILREMKRRKISLPTILFTMFDVFPSEAGNLTFQELDTHLKNQFQSFFLGSVFFNASENNWKVALQEYLKNID